MSCNCDFCQYYKQYKEMIEQIENPEVKKFFENLYNQYSDSQDHIDGLKNITIPTLQKKKCQLDDLLNDVYDLIEPWYRSCDYRAEHDLSKAIKMIDAHRRGV